MSDASDIAAAFTALIDGAHYVNAEAARIMMGNARDSTFRQIASRPDFPRAVKLGKRLAWKRAEIVKWLDSERDRQNKAA